MQIKRFEAENMAEALKKVKNEMGTNAVILSTKNGSKKGRRYGIPGRNIVEVTAALDTEFVDSNKHMIYTASKQNKQITTFNNLSSNSNRENNILDFNNQRKFDREKNDSDFEIKVELNEIKSMILSLKNRPERLNRSNISGLIFPFYKKLISTGITEEFTFELIDSLQQKINLRKEENFNTDEKRLNALFGKIIEQRVLTGKTIDENDKKKKIMALIGPTGVGKTTTIAKITAGLVFAGNKVGLITIDTYRIAATEQLKIYARIIGIPVEVVTTSDEIYNAIKMFDDMDYILIDTAGTSYQDDQRMKTILSTLKDDMIERHLVLSAGMDTENIEKVVKAFMSAVPIVSFLFTKLDETCKYGDLFNAVTKWKIPISYLTMGQKVPEDIEKATSVKIANYIMSGYHNN